MVSSKADSNLVSAGLTGAASVILLFTCISAPVVGSLRMFRLSNTANGAIRYVDVGLWGYCVQPLRMTGYNSYTYDPDVREGCSPSHVGYSLDSNVANALRAPGINGLFPKALTALLILYPIVTVLSALLCLFQTLIHLSNKRRHSSLTFAVSSRGVKGVFIFNALVALLVFLAFIMQIAVVATARARVEKLRWTESFSLGFHWENTIYLSVIALLLHIIDLFVLRSWRKKRLSEEREEEAGQAARRARNQSKPKGGRKFFGRANRNKSDPDAAEESKEVTPGKAEEAEQSKEDGEIEEVPVANSPPAYDLDGYVEEGGTKKT